MVLGGVGLQIEQLARRERVLVDDELVPVGLECGEAPVLADRHIARLGCRVVQVSEERPSLAVGNRRRTRDLAQRRGHVEVLDERIDDERIASSGRADDEWHADRALVHHALRHEAVVARHLAVVARVDDPRVRQLALRVERSDHSAHGVVDDTDVRRVRPAHSRNGVVGHGLAVGYVLERAQQSRVRTRVVEIRAARGTWAGHLDTGVAVDRLHRCVPRIVRPREPHEREERLVAVVLLDPLDRTRSLPGVEVRVERNRHRSRVPHGEPLRRVQPALVVALVAAVRDVLPVCSEQSACLQHVGVRVRQLEAELVARLVDLREPERLESRRQLVDVAGVHVLVAVEMGLADLHRVVAGRAQRLEIRGRVGVHFCPVGVHAVVAYVPLSDERRARRHTQRPLAAHAREAHALCRQAVEVRGQCARVTGAAHHVGAVLVRHDEQDVGALRHLTSAPLGQNLAP